jgi:hypothetical protein
LLGALREERPVEEIAALAEELGVDLMVVGSRGGGGIRRVLTGRAFDWAVRRACCPVLVVGAEARVADIASGGFDRITGRHALDGSLT